ncbi:hypothetical protein HER15_08020 [Tenacibaculum mesophilum]|uniref:TnsE C-terminal domain-containing protein n=1 Tax=Tenacibaculum mesophilum TaxID=104268 RepID=A0AAE9MNR3_9FLAO|nr:hypothetical protein [Tenacibaculum mesophilum]UTD15414.1 hypothetical protein HER15_08020 [Tenacibaculum mesophilum]
MKSPKIKFNPKAPGRYWFLTQVGKVVFKDLIFQVKFHFINTYQANSLYKGFNNSYKETHILAIEYLDLFSRGTIYDTVKNEIITPDKYYNKKWGIKLTIPPSYYPTTKEIPFANSKYSGLDNIDLSDIQYYKFKEKKSNGYKTNVYMFMDTVCNYLFLKHSSRLISLILKHSISSLFLTSEKRVFVENEKVIGYIKYDNQKLKYSEAKAIAPFLFMKNNLGEKALTQIESNLKSFFIKNKNNQEKLNEGTYLKTFFPFHNSIDFELQGRSFSVDNNSYFTTTRIVGHVSKEDTFDVDEIHLKELFPNNSTQERDSKNIQSIIKPHTVLSEQALSNLTNEIGNSAVPTHHNIDKIDNMQDSFSLPVKKIIRSDQYEAYDVSSIPSDKEIKGATLSTYENNPLSENIRTNFISIFYKRIKISKFELMKLVVNKLENIYNVKCSYDNLGLRIPANKIYVLNGHKVMIIEMVYTHKSKDYYSYIIEFEKGHAGFIHNVNMHSIPQFTIEIFIDLCLLKLKNLNKNERVWSSIYSLSNKMESKHLIKIGTALTHQTKELNNNDEIAEKMAEKIFNDRICKLVS